MQMRKSSGGQKKREKAKSSVTFSRELHFYPSKNYSLIHRRLFEYLKAGILTGISTWSDMGQQNAQAKKVH